MPFPEIVRFVSMRNIGAVHQLDREGARGTHVLCVATVATKLVRSRG